MTRWFNIGGPCAPTDNYMLSATERLPEVVSLIGKKQSFVWKGKPVHIVRC